VTQPEPEPDPAEPEPEEPTPEEPLPGEPPPAESPRQNIEPEEAEPEELEPVEPEPEERYGLVVAGSAARAIQRELPEPVAWAAIEFINGPLLDNPRRVGHPLQNELAGLYGARVGDYRVVYRINEEQREVEVIRVAHRAKVYGIE
jgi:mRNA interferase RelE/StbE